MTRAPPPAASSSLRFNTNSKAVSRTASGQPRHGGRSRSRGSGLAGGGAWPAARAASHLGAGRLCRRASAGRGGRVARRGACLDSALSSLVSGVSRVSSSRDYL